MADSKLADLTEITSLSGTDLMYVVSDPSGTPADKKLSFTNLKTNVVDREVLTAARTYYVDGSSGSDSNNGLTTGAAFATVQKAIDVVAGLDISIYDVTIDLYSAHSSTQTFTENLTLKDPVGSGQVIIKGNSSNQDSITIANSSGSVITCETSIKYKLLDLKINETNGDTAIYVTNFGNLVVEGLHIAGVSGTFGLYANAVAYITATSGTNNMKISGAPTYIFLAGNSATVRLDSQTVNTDSITSFNTFSFASGLGIINLSSITYTTTAIAGKKFNIITNSVGFGVTSCPGNTSGSTGTGGQAT